MTLAGALGNAMLVTLALTLASCRAAAPPHVDWPKVVRGAAALNVLAQSHGQTIIVCLVGDAPKAVLMDAPSGAQKPSGAVQDGAP
jgi:hypothetical protein